MAAIDITSVLKKSFIDIGADCEAGNIEFREAMEKIESLLADFAERVASLQHDSDYKYLSNPPFEGCDQLLADAPLIKINKGDAK